MKLALFTIALLSISFSTYTQSATSNAFRFHHVIKKKRLFTFKEIEKGHNDPSTKSSKEGTKNGVLNPIEKPQKYSGKDGEYKCNRWYDLVYVVDESKPENVQRLTMASRRLKCNIFLEKGTVYVDFWPMSELLYYKGGKSRTPGSDTIAGGTKINPGYFKLDLQPRNKLGVYTPYLKVGFRSFALGVSVGTFRYRAKQDTTNGVVAGTVSSALSLNVNFGYAIGFSKITSKRMTNYAITPGGFIGFSAVKLDNTVVENPGEWRKTLDDRTNPAISYGANVVLSRNNLGFVFSLGFDCNIGPKAKQWVYQNKPWIGIGVNANIGIF